MLSDDGYVGGNPISYTDPLGLVAEARILDPIQLGGGGGGGQAVVNGIGLGIGIGIGGAMESRGRGQQDPVSGLKPTNPGKDCNGKCNACPSPQVWAAPGDAHGSTSGTHYHGIIWNQDPSTCMCYPTRVSGSDPSNLR